MELVVPAFDPEESWPTLGPQVCDWIETYLCFGPGDLLGEPAVLDAETRALIYRLYEVFPPYHPQAGRRRFRRAGISLRKGTAKTEKAAWITAGELSVTGPVRCDGFDALGEPVGRPVTDPYIPMVAVTEEQSEELAYGALKAILEESELADDYDIGLERILRKDGHGKAEAVAGQPNSRDGARTTFQLFDESHRLKGNKLREAHRVMLENIVKRKESNGWSLEVTTAPQPGEESIAELTWQYAEQVAEGKLKDADLFFFHRQASDGYDLDKEDDVRAAVIEASGETVAAWSDIEGIVSRWRDPTTSRPYFERVWLNRKVQSSAQVFDITKVRSRISDRTKRQPPRGTPISLGFDGSKTEDSTGLIGTEIETGYQWMINVWEQPPEGHPDRDTWEVPVDEVEQIVEWAFSTYEVCKFYCDPWYWQTQVNEWYGRWPDSVVKYNTNSYTRMATDVRTYVDAWSRGEISFDGHPTFLKHLANARKAKLKVLDDKGEPLYYMTKEHRHSVNKIDLAMAGCLSWIAKNDSVAKGAGRHTGGSKPGRTTVYFGS